MAADPRRAKRLFDEALERPPADRAAFLDGACGGDVELRRQVDALLGALERADEFLVEPAGESAELEEKPGSVIDRYKLLQEIGEGGMGTVWMAEQQQPVKRKVALKVIKLGMDTKQVVARFEAERQALALMDHPGIAKVLDGGATQQGRPYFVMELVKGVPITEYCDQANLGAAARLELFQQVCHAVQHAHQKGVIHRDLKPGNILVTNADDGSPLPKVIDFGVAKATSAELTQKTLFTEFRQMVGTPEYMAPEQAELTALDVDTRADVYSLGVLLYELLTGTKPFELSSILEKGYAEMMRVIREDDPPKPSTRVSTLGDQLQAVAKRRHVSPAMLSKLMRGDLDWIVMRALEKDRNRRYATANDLAADLGRHLAHEPVHASPPSASYRLRKYVRRHRVGVTAAGLVFVALIGGLALATWGFVEADQQRVAAEKAGQAAIDERNAATEAKNDALAQKERADDERDRAAAEEKKAKTEAARANTVIDLVEEMLGSADPSQQKGPDYTVRELLEEFDRGLGDRLVDQPEVEITLRRLLRSAFSNLSIWERALHDARGELAAARRLPGPQEAEIAESLCHVGVSLQELQQLEEAEQMLREGLALATETGDTSPLVGRLETRLAGCLFEQWRFPEALDMARRARDHTPRSDSGSFIAALLILGKAQSQFDPTAAESTLRQACKLAREFYKSDHSGSLARTMGRLADFLFWRGKYREALRIHQKILEIDRALSGESSRNFGATLKKLADCHAKLGDPDEAESLYRRALEIMRNHEGGKTADTAHVAFAFAEFLSRFQPTEEVVGLLKETVEIYGNTYGPDHQRTLLPMTRLANARIPFITNAEEEQEVLDLIDAAASAARPSSEDPDNVLAAALYARGQLHQARKRYAQAEDCYQQSLDITQEKFGADHEYTWVPRLRLAECLLVQGKAAKAEAVLRTVLASTRGQAREDHPANAFATRLLGELLANDKARLDEAARLLEEVVSRWRKEQHRELGRALLDLGHVRMSQREYAKAEASFREALEAYPATDDPAAGPVLWGLSLALQGQGEFEESLEYMRKVLPLLRQQGDHARVAGVLALEAEASLQRGDDAAAERQARECLEIRTRLMPDSWLRYNTMSMLGGALSGLGRFEEAEPLLLEGYENMVVPPAVPIPRKRQALERIVKLYEAWGREDDAAKWRKKLEDGK